MNSEDAQRAIREVFDDLHNLTREEYDWAVKRAQEELHMEFIDIHSPEFLRQT
jgi:hypothetical protein